MNDIDLIFSAFTYSWKVSPHPSRINLSFLIALKDFLVPCKHFKMSDPIL